MPQPAAVMAGLRSRLEELTPRLKAHFAFMTGLYLVWEVLGSALTLAVPSAGVASPWPIVVMLAFFFSQVVYRDAYDAIRCSLMLRHGADSSGGQQPGMP